MRTLHPEFEGLDCRVGLSEMCGHHECRSGFGAPDGSRAMRTLPKLCRFESGCCRRTHGDLPRRSRTPRRLRASLPRAGYRCCFASDRRAMGFDLAAGDLCISPNKAPEPTPTSGMPRAISRATEAKRWSAESNPARVMPDAGVAHL